MSDLFWWVGGRRHVSDRTLVFYCEPVSDSKQRGCVWTRRTVWLEHLLLGSLVPQLVTQTVRAIWRQLFSEMRIVGFGGGRVRHFACSFAGQVGGQVFGCLMGGGGACVSGNFRVSGART